MNNASRVVYADWTTTVKQQHHWSTRVMTLTVIASWFNLSLGVARLFFTCGGVHNVWCTVSSDRLCYTRCLFSNEGGRRFFNQLHACITIDPTLFTIRLNSIFASAYIIIFTSSRYFTRRCQFFFSCYPP